MVATIRSRSAESDNESEFPFVITLLKACLESDRASLRCCCEISIQPALTIYGGQTSNAPEDKCRTRFESREKEARR